MKKSTIGILSTFIGMTVGVVTGALATGKVMSKKLKKENDISNKHLALFLMMDQWVKVKQDGKKLSSYFEKNGYKRIAIYGMSYAGRTLVEELKGSNIEISYGIDRNAANIYNEFEILTPDDDLEDVDAIVVTPIFFMDEIEKMLLEKVSCPIVSLENIVFEV